ncbi:MAG TPA: hypothetical protein VFY45_06270 [Baekduia sp.]|nr:hypothetical protein [Baekduia sp.]
MVPKDEIRLRIAAAKALNPELDTWEKLAKATKISTSTLKNIATPHRKAKAEDNDEKYLHTIAEACGLPYAWFTVPDLGAAVRREDEDPSLVERVEALEHIVATLMRRDGPTPPGPSSGGDPPPAPGGELGRRLQERATKSADPAPPGSAPEEGSAPESAG